MFVNMFKETCAYIYVGVENQTKDNSEGGKKDKLIAGATVSNDVCEYLS